MHVDKARDMMCCIKKGCGCCGSYCMAWRWHHEDTFIGETVGGEKLFTTAKGLCLKLKATAVWQVRRVRSDGNASNISSFA